jgi:hypothetical protein
MSGLLHGGWQAMRHRQHAASALSATLGTRSTTGSSHGLDRRTFISQIASKNYQPID